MISRKVLNNVLRNVVAAGEEPSSMDPAQGTPTEEPRQNINKPVQRWRYYFFDAPPENSIKFGYLSEILKRDTPERTALIKKLQGGNTGKYFADYFSWKKVIIATTQYSPDGKTLTVYEADLTPMGTKIAGSEKVYPESSNATVENFETDLILYSDKRGNSGVLNIDNSGESLFSDQDPPNNLVNILLSRTRPAGRFINYNDFSKIFDEYRVWATNLNQLLLPNFDLPKNDDVSGGHYVGGQAAFDKIVVPVIQGIEKKEQQQPQEPSLLKKTDKDNTAEKESPFESVDEQDKSRVRGDNLDIPTGSPMAQNKKRFSSEDYKIQRMARKVLAGYIGEEASLEEEAAATSTTVKGIGLNPKTEVQNFKAKATKNRTLAKKYDEIAQMMTQFQDLEKS
jgi:hypothetical protein